MPKKYIVSVIFFILLSCLVPLLWQHKVEFDYAIFTTEYYIGLFNIVIIIISFIIFNILWEKRILQLKDEYNSTEKNKMLKNIVQEVIDLSVRIEHLIITKDKDEFKKISENIIKSLPLIKNYLGELNYDDCKELGILVDKNLLTNDIELLFQDLYSRRLFMVNIASIKSDYKYINSLIETIKNKK